MIQISDKSLCSGCGACRAVCPRKCIALEHDEEGFAYPVTDPDQCVECGICERICPVLNRKEGQPSVRRAFAAVNSDEETRRQSSSGGMFTLLARQTIEEGGAVFGAAYGEDLQVFHICVQRGEEIEKLRVSKYVQSSTGDTYVRAKEFLETGKPVLFTGTPCQTAGLYAFLGRDYPGLVTQDIVCHGVPSPMVWETYLDFEKKKYGKRPVLLLRTKKEGWKNWQVLMRYADGTERTEGHSENLFMRSFLSNLYLRPSCHHCAFKGGRCISDLTLGDFWGIESVCPEMDDGMGTSLVLVHSEKGERVLDRLSGKIKLKEVNEMEAIKGNPAAFESVSAHPKREKFFVMLKERPFDEAVEKCLKKSLIRHAGKEVYMMLCRMKQSLK